MDKSKQCCGFVLTKKGRFLVFGAVFCGRGSVSYNSAGNRRKLPAGTLRPAGAFSVVIAQVVRSFCSDYSQGRLRIDCWFTGKL
jgi:hypothetical protein